MLLDHLGVDKKDRDYPALNTTLSREHIRLYDALPILRSRNNPRMDSILKFLLPSKTPPPFALSKALAEKIIADTHDDNLRLLERLDDAGRKAVQNDDRWWMIDRFLHHWAAPQQPEN